MRFGRAVILAVVLSIGVGACADSDSEDRVKVVAALHPLAWVTEQVGGNRVEVEDLTASGVDAHDTALSAGQRANLQTADIVVFLGDIGFQPDVEHAVDDARGVVVNVTRELGISVPTDRPFDPHIWLDPGKMEEVV
ncbi:MAG: metal ABC transporter substrate-binding protein, partial [Actinomycetota bacterium]